MVTVSVWAEPSASVAVRGYCVGASVKVSVVVEEMLVSAPVPPACLAHCTGRHVSVVSRTRICTSVTTGSELSIDTVSVPLGRAPVCVGRGDATENVVLQVYDGRRKVSKYRTWPKRYSRVCGSASLLGPLVA